MNPKSWSAALLGIAMAALLIGIALLGLAYGESLRNHGYFAAHPLVAAGAQCGSAGVILLLLLHLVSKGNRDSHDS
ncbi:MAG TPA: hypothetical protein VFS24_05835 [Steroidobacteraceae bacterium]|nr:hypothetical protein [Steroidobacteraceae bacterium]